MQGQCLGRYGYGGNYYFNRNDLSLERKLEMLQERKEIVTQNLLFDHGVDNVGMLELSPKVLVQHMKSTVANFER